MPRRAFMAFQKGQEFKNALGVYPLVRVPFGDFTKVLPSKNVGTEKT